MLHPCKTTGSKHRSAHMLRRHSKRGTRGPDFTCYLHQFDICQVAAPSKLC